MSFSIPPLGTFSIETDGEGEIVSGSATVSSNLDLGGVVRFTFPGVGTAAVLEGTPLSNMVVPMRRSPDGLNTGLAIMNPGEDSVWVTLTLFDTAGVQVPSGTHMMPSLPAGGHIARFLDELFPDADTDDFHGSLVISTFQGSLVATALEIGDMAYGPGGIEKPLTLISTVSPTARRTGGVSNGWAKGLLPQRPVSHS